MGYRTGERAAVLSWSRRVPWTHFNQERKPGAKATRRVARLTLANGHRSGVPVSTRWTFTPAIVASVHCPCAALRHHGFACFRSSLAGTGTPSLIKCGATQEAGSGSDWTDSTVRSTSTCQCRLRGGKSLVATAVPGQTTRHPAPPGGRMPPISTSGRMKTSAFRPSAQGKSGTMPELSVKPAA